LFCLAGSLLFGQREIRVTLDEGIPMIPVAVPQFVLTESSAPDEALQGELYQTFMDDLKYSRVFTLISEKYYEYIDEFDPDHIEYRDWGSIQAKILVTGKLEIISEARIVFQIRVYDVESERFIFGKSFSGDKKLIRVIAHKCADEMMKYFGEKMLFDSKIAFVSTRDGNEEIYFMDYDGRRKTRVTFNDYIDLLPTWSRDNQKLLYTSYRRGECDLYLFHLYSGNLSILSTGGTNYSADWCRDSNKIVYTSTKNDGNAEIYVKDMDTGRESRLTFNRIIDTSPSWSPSGSEIVFVSQRSGNPHIYIMNASGANIRKISSGGKHHDSPDWSPDGSRIVYVSMVNWRLDLFVFNLKTNRVIKLTQDAGRNEMPSWSPDGRHIIFASDRSGAYQIYSVDYDGKNLKQLTFKGKNTMPSWQKN
jgi:TolB protein